MFLVRCFDDGVFRYEILRKELPKTNHFRNFGEGTVELN